jgi:hypothetical protein
MEMMMYPDVHLLASKLITVGEVRVTTEDPRTPPRLTFFSLPLTKIGLLLMASFSSTPEMASSTKEKPGPLHTLPQRGHRGTTTEPTGRSPSKSNKLMISHSN